MLIGSREAENEISRKNSGNQDLDLGCLGCGIRCDGSQNEKHRKTSGIRKPNEKIWGSISLSLSHSVPGDLKRAMNHRNASSTSGSGNQRKRRETCGSSDTINRRNHREAT